MTRQRIACTAILGALFAAVGLGVALRVQGNADWWQQLADAETAITANQTALNSAHATGQDVHRLQQQCTAAVADYNRAADHLTLPQLNPDLECTP